MKKGLQLTVLVMLIFSLVISCVPMNAFAATKYKNGTYKMQSKDDSSGNIYKLKITVKKGVITSTSFDAYNNGTHLTKLLLVFIKKDEKDGFKALLDDLSNINKQLKKTKDGSKVTGSKEDKVYIAFIDCWNQFTKKAK